MNSLQEMLSSWKITCLWTWFKKLTNWETITSSLWIILKMCFVERWQSFIQLSRNCLWARRTENLYLKVNPDRRIITEKNGPIKGLVGISKNATVFLYIKYNYNEFYYVIYLQTLFMYFYFDFKIYIWRWWNFVSNC